ncbi:hypothetical protein D9M71_364720 [compost metagenome]
MVAVLDHLPRDGEKLQTVELRAIHLGLFAGDQGAQALFQAIEIDRLVLPERPRLAQLEGESLGAELAVGIGTEGDARLALQQHRIDPGATQALQFGAGVLATFAPGIEGELFDLRTTNRRVQVIVQAIAPGTGEERRGQALQLGGAQGLVATAVLVAAAEQAVDVLLQITLAAAHRLRVAEEEQQARRRLQLAAGDALQQAVEQFDGRRFIAMDARRQQQVAAVVASADRRYFQYSLGQPVQARAIGSELDFLGRLATGKSQFKQFAEG